MAWIDVYESSGRQKGSKQRLQQYRKQARGYVAEWLQKEADIPEGMFFSVADVVVEPGGNAIRVYVSVFPEGNSKEVLRMLKKQAGSLRSYLARHISHWRVHPKPFFVLTDEIEREVNMQRRIDGITEEL